MNLIKDESINESNINLLHKVCSANISINDENSVSYSFRENNFIDDNTNEQNEIIHTFIPQPVKSMPSNCFVKEHVSAKYLIISADLMFHYLWSICKRTQLQIFAYDDTQYKFELYKWKHSKKLRKTKPMPVKPKNSYIYINNFMIFVDSIFRMITLFNRYMKLLKKSKFNFDTIILINDIDYTKIPQPPAVWHLIEKKFCTQYIIVRSAINLLKEISTKVYYNDLLDYDIFEEHLCKKYPELYNFSLHNPSYRIIGFNNNDYAPKYFRRFMYHMSLLQMQLSVNEVKKVWSMVIDCLSRQNDVKVFNSFHEVCSANVLNNNVSSVNESIGDVSSTNESTTNESKINDTITNKSSNRSSKIDSSIYQPINSTDSLFDYNILRLFKNYRTICITRQYIPDNNIFYFDFRKVYYPKSIGKYKYISFNYLPTKLPKYRQHKQTIMSNYNFIESECNGRIININEDTSLMMFSDPKNLTGLYIKNKIDLIRRDKYSEYEYDWMTPEMIQSSMNDIINDFNRKFKTFVL